MPIEPMIAAPFVSLWIGVVGVFLNQRGVSVLFTIVSLILALFADVVQPPALAPLAILFLSATLTIFCYRNDHLFAKYLFWLCLILAVIVSFGMGVHAFPGFDNPLIVKNVSLAKDSIPYTLYWSYDKAITAYVLTLLYRSLAKSDKFTLYQLKQTSIVAIVTVIVILSGAILMGLIAWEPKVPDFIFFWLLANLFITCTAEEAFFRGLIQYQTHRLLKTSTRHSAIVAITFAGILFGAAHFAMGIEYVLIASVAGFGYGLAFQLTGRLEASIIAHFLMNITHILFFTYPMIQQV